ncbi:MAG: aminotransferase class I/II-fold pyridoxal phosphate-dependent enzyme [Actinobacteria bacterium]|nr:aminotransferase class I/II-fold pyridoxal phosphate-dependent enzyme [Actinomycetota bacterium]
MDTAKYIKGSTASEIAASIESAITSDALKAESRLPTVRALAESLGVSHSTVASAYRTLQLRNLISSQGRSGTLVNPRPQFGPRPGLALPSGVRDLASGNPSPELLPPLGRYLPVEDAPPRLYGEKRNLEALLEIGREWFGAGGVDAEAMAVTNGALDAVERLLAATSAGDRVIVEDPGFWIVRDLLTAHGRLIEPVPIDQEGFRPEALERALGDPVAAIVYSPVAQNPTGAVLTERRATELRSILAGSPDAFLIENDHANLVAGATAGSLIEPNRKRWAVVRTVSKALGPDLRLALVAGDRHTIDTLESRQQLGTAWVSHIMQQTVARMLADVKVRKGFGEAAAIYDERRQALIAALAAGGVPAYGSAGMNVWVPVAEESSLVSQMIERGWGICPGERFRVRSEAAVRITISTLEPDDARKLAQDMAEVMRGADSSARSA